MISSYAQVVTVLLLFDFDAFFYFSSLMAIGKSRNTTLNESGKSEHPCLVSSLKSISLLPLCMMLAVLPWWLSGKEPTCQSKR